jgi:hypothetical protein
MTHVYSINDSLGCLAGKMDAITYLKSHTLPGIIQKAKNGTGSKINVDHLIHLSETLENLPDFSNGIIKSNAVNELLEEEFPGCDETKQCIESYANNISNGKFNGIYYDVFEQVLKTIIGMKVYLKTESDNSTIINDITDKRNSVRFSARVLKRFNTKERLFDLGYAREAIGNTVRETGHTKGSANVVYDLIELIEQSWKILEDNSEFSDDFADCMEVISETAINTRQSSAVSKVLKNCDSNLNNDLCSRFKCAG